MAAAVTLSVCACGNQNGDKDDAGKTTSQENPEASKETPAEETSSEAEKSEESQAESEAGGAAEVTYPLKEKVHLTLAMVDEAAVTANAKNLAETPFGKAWQEATGVELEIMQLADGDALNLLYASGELPDMIAYSGYTGGAEKAIKDKIIQPLNDYMQYAPDLQAVLDSNDLYKKSSTTKDGDIIGFPFIRGDDYLLSSAGLIIRQDWLDEVGMDMPTNEAELEEVGRAWKEAGLGTLGNSLITQSFTYEYPYFDDSISEEEYGKYLDLTVAPLTWEPSEKYLKNLNEEYNEGIVDQEFYLNAQDTDWKADFVSGRCGTYKFRIGNTTDVFDSLLANNPDAEVSTLDPGALSPEGKGYYYAYPPYGMVMGISTTTPAEERAAVWMYLEWLSQPENLFKMQMGWKVTTTRWMKMELQFRLPDSKGNQSSLKIIIKIIGVLL